MAVSAISRRIESFSQQSRIKAGSLITSLLGDVVVPRGGRIWLGSLIDLLEPMGLNERLVRTTVFRLVRDGWLESKPLGRRTDYLLSPTGSKRIEKAAKSIYASSHPNWDRRWRLIMVVGDLSAKDRDRLRKALIWQGFGVLGGNCFVHPSADLTVAFDGLVRDGLGDLLKKLKPLMAAGPGALSSAASDVDMVNAAWDLDQLAQMYRDFLSRYQPILSQCQTAGDTVTAQQAFVARVLLIHDYRRLLLRDPMLPDVLQPMNWPGQQARLLCGELYRRLLPASEQFLDRHYQLADGSTPVFIDVLQERFREADPLPLTG
ncbi:phenylacetic acid degradation operon negative regulatory protein PaaX [Orrella daihaiensis]|uniref:Phenylacetic acid degradation operon negative regulatory protein PaaX n=1 Tax=Orrella daihaiensis TaxID=2782176 RepID=A0ABY4AQ46_9BURK|nr:phenylacetic acid degradation operon negative regulatory protein PaaX [Orrella daihaiensis]UOD51157.1 phenylacetic acid degradation operon negative regulatory protein PaaX [Orrella daihaiensis]